jgi:hypothetical protein
MLLRASDQNAAASLELAAIIEGADVDSGVPAGSQLLRFVDAALRDPEHLAQARNDLIAAVGLQGMVDAAGVLGNFQRMVRIADSTGITLDKMFAAPTQELRERLNLDALSSARLAD